MDEPPRRGRRWLLAALLIGGLCAAYALVWRPPPEALVVYCAHDAIFADDVLRRFEAETGIPVEAVYDSEATKSLGLIERIEREAAAPRADVLWNNEQLGTMALAYNGRLAAYQGPGWKRIPPAYRDREGRWAGFGARLRVWIVNSAAIKPGDVAGLKAALARGDLSRVAIAKPLYGTTLTHYAVRWASSPSELKRWHVDWRDRGVVEVNGNAVVRDLVAQGKCDVGLTDTDDAFGALDSGHKVWIHPVELARGAPVAIPNTAAVIAGTRREANARKLVDYLLSEANELALARSASRQVPVGPIEDPSQIPKPVRDLMPAVKRGVPLSRLREAREQCLAWLKQVYK